jgi:beta-xylosidase
VSVPFFSGVVVVVCLMSSLLSVCHAQHDDASPRESAERTNYLFSYFKGNGEDGLHLAYSHDGLNWTPLNNDKPFVAPKVGKVMRDPCILQGTDGVFHMVWTAGPKGIGMAHSKDLINWSEQEWIPVMEHEPKARNCWAPEIFYDDVKDQYLIFWSTTIPGRFPETDKTGDEGYNHRIYYATTKDLKSYTGTKLFYDDGFNVIDATIVKDRDRYVMFLKDETRRPTKKNIRFATSENADGPYGPASEPISLKWVEGPTAIKIGDEWIVYFDEYTRGRYGAVKSKDLKHWESISDKLSFPEGARHGTIFTVSDEVLAKLLELR